MKIFCYLDSSGDIDHTNLQLYSLRQAARCWNELAEELSAYGEEGVEQIKERLVFIVNCLGLSLSQLLGQNWSSKDQKKMDEPGNLLSNILNSSHVKKVDKARLNKGFQDIFRVYGAIRHFGEVKDDENYRIVHELNLSVLKRYKRITVDLWDIVIAIQRSHDLNEIEDFGSIADQVVFEELPEKIAGEEAE